MKRQIIAKINNIANELDKNGLYAEANALTNVMKKLAELGDESMIELPDVSEKGTISIMSFEHPFRILVTARKGATYLGEKTGRETDGEFERFTDIEDAENYAAEWAEYLQNKYNIPFEVKPYSKPKPFSPDYDAMAYDEERDRRSSY